MKKSNHTETLKEAIQLLKLKQDSLYKNKKD